jgi:putative ubiquitin-RnfH superfamily antitoxin RatB of RatAB toxin-antitoxin module
MSEAVPERKYPLVLVSLREAGPSTYSIEDAARMAGIHPELLRHYCRLGIFGRSMAAKDADPVFDDDSLYELLRFEHFRRFHGWNRRTARLICNLLREVERLQAELRFRRGP